MPILQIISIITSFFSTPDLFLTHLVGKTFGKLIARYYSQQAIYWFNKFQDVTKILDPDIIMKVLKKASPKELLALEKDIKDLQDISIKRMAKQLIGKIIDNDEKNIKNGETLTVDQLKDLVKEKASGSSASKPKSKTPASKSGIDNTNPIKSDAPASKGSTGGGSTSKKKSGASPTPIDKTTPPKKSGESSSSGNGEDVVSPVKTEKKKAGETADNMPKPEDDKKGSGGTGKEVSKSSSSVSQDDNETRRKLSSSWVQYGSFQQIRESVLGMLTIWVNSDADPKHRWYGPYTYPYVNRDIWTAMLQAKGKNGSGAGSVMWSYFLRSWLPSALRKFVVSHKEQFSQNTLARNKSFIQELTVRYAKADKTKIVKSKIAFGEKQYQLAKQRQAKRQAQVGNVVIKTNKTIKKRAGSSMVKHVGRKK